MSKLWTLNNKLLVGADGKPLCRNACPCPSGSSSASSSATRNIVECLGCTDGISPYEIKLEVSGVLDCFGINYSQFNGTYYLPNVSAPNGGCVWRLCTDKVLSNGAKVGLAAEPNQAVPGEWGIVVTAAFCGTGNFSTYYSWFKLYPSRPIDCFQWNETVLTTTTGGTQLGFYYSTAKITSIY